MGKNRKRMGGKSQKKYKMKGCNKKSRKNHLGGSDVNLAYPSSNVHTVPNPFLAYTGKGGAAYNNTNSAYPSTGPLSTGFNFLNPQIQKGGNCGCGALVGGSNTSHRDGCKCSSCKMTGGSGASYPSDLVGSAWSSSTNSWPGVNGIPGDGNHYALNTYAPNDISRQMINTGAAAPFSIGGKRGIRRNKSNKSKKNLKNRFSKSKRGGSFSNFLGQDLINVGRQLQFGLGSAYNGLTGYSAPSNPLPWKGQLANTPTLASVKSLM